MSELDPGSARLSMLGLTFQHKEGLRPHACANSLHSLAPLGTLLFVP